MARLDAESYSRIRALVEDGKIPVGSAAHLGIIDWEVSARRLNKRDQQIVKMAIRGLGHAEIAKHVKLTRSRVSTILRDFFQGG